MALSGSVLKRLPLSTSMLYLAVGFGLGPHGFGLIRLDPVRDAAVLERFAEVAVIVSLFTAGLKLRVGLRDALWELPVRLASGSMAVTIGLIAVAGVVGLGLPWGAAILLGAILAPTDPVLASDVQVTDPTDRDRLRFALTGEAGLNDGAAFPFVMLGLGLLGLHEIGAAGWRWVAVDLVWAVVGGLAIGALLGELVARIVLYLRRTHKEAVGLDDFLALGLIALATGRPCWCTPTASWPSSRRASPCAASSGWPAANWPPGRSWRPPGRTRRRRPIRRSRRLHGRVRARLQRATGANRWRWAWSSSSAGCSRSEPFRPRRSGSPRCCSSSSGRSSVVLGLLGSRVSSISGRSSAGSASGASVRSTTSCTRSGTACPPTLARPLVALTLSTVAVSIVVHGISVTPLMNRYRSHAEEEAAGIEGT